MTPSVSIATQDDLSYCFTVENAGAAVESGNSIFDVTAFFSADTTLDPGDTEWVRAYSAWQYPLSEDFSQQSCDALPLGNAAVAPGTYYVIFLVDAYPGQGPNFYPGVVESDENNNWRASVVQVTITP